MSLCIEAENVGLKFKIVARVFAEIVEKTSGFEVQTNEEVLENKGKNIKIIKGDK
jgi:hypothetical protein